MKKLFIAAMAAVMSMSVLAGCREDKEELPEGTRVDQGQDLPDDYSVSEENMEYGATAVELRPESDPNAKVMICFDRRYFSQDDYGGIYKVTDYISGLNTNDHKLITDSFYPGYLEYTAKSNNYESADEYIDNYYNYLTTYLGEEFDIDYVHISKSFGESSDIAQSYFSDADKAITDISGADALNKVESRRVIEIGGDTCYQTKDGVFQFTAHAPTEIIVCIYKIDGQFYLL